MLEVFGYIPLDVGMKYGFFDREGLEIEEINFTGGSKLTQAFTAGAVDIGLSSGPEMAFIAKGAPEIAVGSITNSPAFMAIVVSANSAVRNLDDLKGKKFGVTTVGSLTSWLVDELNRVKGWTTDADRAVSIAIGGEPAAQLSAFKTGQIDASITSPGGGYQLEEAKVGRLLIDVSSYVKDLQLFTIFASNAIVQQNPDAVRRFLSGWYKTVAYMKTHKAETVADYGEHDRLLGAGFAAHVRSADLALFDRRKVLAARPRQAVRVVRRSQSDGQVDRHQQAVHRQVSAEGLGLPAGLPRGSEVTKVAGRISGP